jgi:hypothetical protein
MSHIVTIKTEVRDQAAIAAACLRMQLADPVAGEAKLFSGPKAGIVIQLPDWHYPIVCETATGQVHFDNFEGRWGKREHLDRFLQLYAVEKARLEARKRGHTVYEQTLRDGSIKLTLHVKGQA